MGQRAPAFREGHPRKAPRLCPAKRGVEMLNACEQVADHRHAQHVTQVQQECHLFGTPGFCPGCATSSNCGNNGPDFCDLVGKSGKVYKKNFHENGFFALRKTLPINALHRRITSPLRDRIERSKSIVFPKYIPSLRVQNACRSAFQNLEPNSRLLCAARSPAPPGLRLAPPRRNPGPATLLQPCCICLGGRREPAGACVNNFCCITDLLKHLPPLNAASSPLSATQPTCRPAPHPLKWLLHKDLRIHASHNPAACPRPVCSSQRPRRL